MVFSELNPPEMKVLLQVKVVSHFGPTCPAHLSTPLQTTMCTNLSIIFMVVIGRKVMHKRADHNYCNEIKAYIISHFSSTKHTAPLILF